MTKHPDIPNAIIFSTRDLEVLPARELRARAASELKCTVNELIELTGVGDKLVGYRRVRRVGEQPGVMVDIGREQQ
jgi:hypothetical protein